MSWARPPDDPDMHEAERAAAHEAAGEFAGLDRPSRSEVEDNPSGWCGCGCGRRYEPTPGGGPS